LINQSFNPSVDRLIGRLIS